MYVIFSKLECKGTAGLEIRIQEERYTLSLHVVLANLEASEVKAYNLNEIYENSSVILGTVLHKIVKGVEKIINFTKFLSPLAPEFSLKF